MFGENLKLKWTNGVSTYRNACKYTTQETANTNCLPDDKPTSFETRKRRRKLN